MRRKTSKRRAVEAPRPRNAFRGAGTLGIILLAILIFLSTRFYLLFFFEPEYSDVVHYFDYVVRAADWHQKPYRDFSVEYPPLAWWTLAAPHLLDQRHVTRPQDLLQVKPILLDYRNTFRGLMFLADLGSFFMLLLIAWKRHPPLAGWAMLLYALSTALLAHLLYDRLDLGLTFLLMCWAYAWLRSLDESGRSIAWTAAAYAMLGLSISFKLIPVIGVPFLLLSEWHAPRRWTRWAWGLLALAVGAGGPFALQYVSSGPGVFALFTHHAEREIQIESLYSTLMMIASLFGYPVEVSHSHGAFNLSGALAPLMKTLSLIFLFGFLAGMGLWAVWRAARFHRQDAYRLVCFLIPAAVILSNVLSPQYFLWAFPLMLLLALEVFPRRPLAPWIFLVLLSAVAAMTTWIFPYHYRELTGPSGLLSQNVADASLLSPLACGVLGLRNLTYLGVVVWLGVEWFRRLNGAPLSETRVGPDRRRR